jgi:hypothetical protein
MTAKIDSVTGTAPTYNLEPATDEGASPLPAGTTEGSEQTEQPPDTSGAASRQLENALEANYIRGQLNQAQYRLGGRNLYDKTSLDPAANATETKASGPVSVAGLKLGASRDSKDVQVKKEIGSAQGYDDEREAIAVARMAGTEPAAVVKINAKWHAVQLRRIPPMPMARALPANTLKVVSWSRACRLIRT